MIYDDVKNYLQKHKYARERKNKNRAIVDILCEKWQVDPQLGFSMDRLVSLCEDFNSYDRLWRLVTSENPELRGVDYDTKQEVEERAQVNLGYSPGYNKDLKIKTTLF